MTRSPTKPHILGIAVGVSIAAVVGNVLPIFSANIAIDYLHGPGRRDTEAGAWLVGIVYFATGFAPPFLAGFIAAKFHPARRMLQAVVAGCLLHLVMFVVGNVVYGAALSSTLGDARALILTVLISVFGGVLAGRPTEYVVCQPGPSDPFSDE